MILLTARPVPWGPTSGSTQTPPEGGGGQVITHVLNPQPNTAFCLFDKAGKLGVGILKHLAPKNAKGQPMCLSWHMRNACNSNCLRVADHWAHTTSKDNAILAWAKIVLASPA